MELPGNGQANGVLERAQAAGEQARLRTLEQKPAAHTRDDLARTAREFEGVFMDILMRAMRSTVPQNDLMGSGGATQIYRQMHDSEIARSLSCSPSVVRQRVKRGLDEIRHALKEEPST